MGNPYFWDLRKNCDEVLKRLQRCWQRSRSCKTSHCTSFSVAKSEMLWKDLLPLNQDYIPLNRAWPSLELMGISL